MILERLNILNYKSIHEASLALSPKINCFIGHNGAGKTNLLDAVYYLSFCRSAFTTIDTQLVNHDWRSRAGVLWAETWHEKAL